MAKSILKKAGIKHLTLTLDYQTYDPQMVSDATLLVSELKQIGITLNLQTIEFPVWLSDLSNTADIPEMMLSEDTDPFPNVGVMLANYWTGAALGVSNRTGYNNPSVNSLVSAALASSSAAAACRDYERAQTIIYNDAQRSLWKRLLYRLGMRPGLRECGITRRRDPCQPGYRTYECRK